MDTNAIQNVHFTDEQVNDFLVNKIDLPNWKMVLHRDKLEFLTQLLQKHSIHVYFHNIRLASVPEHQRAAPVLEQMVADGLGGRGGVCFELNYFLYLLLAAVGFDTFVVSATFPGGLEDCHMMTVVRLGHAQLYLLDVASANPTHVPVPLHQLPHRRLAAGPGCYYEFRPHVSHVCLERSYGRYQIGGSYLSDPTLDNPEHEALRWEFGLAPRSLEHFQFPMHQIFTNPDAKGCGIFLRLPFLFRYLKNDSDAVDWVLVFGLRVLVANNKCRKVDKYSSYSELRVAILEYFPSLDAEELRLAFELFEKVRREEGDRCAKTFDP